MKIISSAQAGTLESSDAYIQVNPLEGDKIELEIHSSVEELYGEMIEELILEILKKMNVTGLHVKVQDKGALDFVLKARLQAAVLRAAEASRNPDWEELL
jgi:citrate lyase subunit gamma (acyl carrier protein)